MRISELSEATGASARSLRYYEQQGLISARRLSNGYREFDAGAVETVRRIRALLDLGLPTETIRDILPCDADGPRQEACAGLMRSIAGIRDRLAAQAAELTRTSAALDRYLGSVAGAVDEAHADPVRERVRRDGERRHDEEHPPGVVMAAEEQRGHDRHQRDRQEAVAAR